MFIVNPRYLMSICLKLIGALMLATGSGCRVARFTSISSTAMILSNLECAQIPAEISSGTLIIDFCHFSKHLNIRELCECCGFMKLNTHEPDNFALKVKQ